MGEGAGSPTALAPADASAAAAFAAFTAASDRGFGIAEDGCNNKINSPSQYLAPERISCCNDWCL